MVTRGTGARLAMLARAVAGYAAQTHRSRELVMVAEDGADREAIAEIVAAHPTEAIRIVFAPATATLGRLRNLSVASANGEIVCQWDDDDLHHPERIARQLAASSGADACLLGDVMQLDAAARVLRWTNWAATPVAGHPGTLLARRERLPAYPEVGAKAALGEDLVVARALASRGGVVPMAGAPHLYVYVSHGGNSWSAGHHAMLADSLAISRGLLLRREAMLRTGLAPFDLAGVTVAGASGPAFTL